MVTSTSSRIIEGNVGAVTMEVARVNTGMAPLSYYSCDLETSLGKSVGYGEAFLPTTAIRKARFEAWERQHLLYVKQELPELRNFTLGYSNGYAAGHNLEDSRRRALEELIERHLVMEAWTQQMGWANYSPKSLRTKFLIQILSSAGWSIEFYRLSAGDHHVLAALGQHRDLGALFDSVYLKQRNESETKLALSVLRSSKIRAANYHSSSNVSVQPESHAAFYSDPKNLEAFDFLEYASAKEKITLKVNDREIQFVSFRLSESLPYVSLAWNKEWIPLCWGPSSIRGSNRWPHPMN